MPKVEQADPVKFASQLWPHVQFYDKQKEIMYSVLENEETIVPAGNMLGKDFVAGYLLLYFFLTRHPVRIVSTSADYSQLKSVLWGEVRRFIQTCAYPLEHTKGGPLVINDLHLRKIDPKTNKVCGLSYAIGRVTRKGEGMLGHHVAEVGDGIPRTFFIADEASGLEDMSYERADTWARRKLLIGNCYPCQNIFYKAIKGGDIKSRVAGRNSNERFESAASV